MITDLRDIFGQWFVLTVKRFPPVKYALYSSLFVGAIQMSDSASPLAASLKWNAYAASGTFLLLWFMRIVDELKDRTHDQQFHATRPLASGEVTVANALTLLAILGMGIAAYSFAHNWTAGSLAMAIMFYSLVLWGAERVWQKFESSMLANLCFAIQLKTMLVFYVWSMLPRSIHPPRPFPITILAIAIVCGYLHWEILRKTHHTTTTNKSYSNEIGMSLSLILGATLLLVANLAVLLFFTISTVAAILLLIASLPSVAGTILFARQRISSKSLSAMTLTGYILFLIALSWLERTIAVVGN